ncbi:MAG: phosphoribosyltransferase [Anaerovoracaceae bacterium]
MSSNNQTGKVLFTREQIEARAAEIGAQIYEDYGGEPVYLICTLRGAVMWMADIMKNVANDTEIDFIMASSYGSGTTSSGVVKIKKDLEGDIYGKNVIIIEDIMTQEPPSSISKNTWPTNPKSIKICTLLDKPSGASLIEADYVLFHRNLFVIGYGLDYDQKYEIYM